MTEAITTDRAWYAWRAEAGILVTARGMDMSDAAFEAMVAADYVGCGRTAPEAREDLYRDERGES